MHSKFLLLFLVSIYLPAFQCQISGSSRCNGGPFNCGSVGYISYPFWGGDRQSYCGRPGFKLVCNDGVPMLNISSLSYKVLEIDFSSYTLKVARQDLANNLCPDILRNTTMDPALFEYQPEYKDNNVTLYFNCTSDDPDIPGQFNCSSGGTGDINLFRAGPGDGTTCEDQIYVPVNEVAAQKLRHPIVSSINQLRSALVEGFSIHWLSDGKQLEAPVCNRNVYASCINVAPARLPRTCSNSTLCRRSGDGGGGLVPGPSPAPQDGQAAQSPGTGMPPEIAQAPGNSPESNGYQPPTGHAKKRVTDDAVGNKRVIEIIVVVLLGITGVVIVSTVICCSKRRHSASVSKQKMNQDIEDTLHGLMALKRYRYSEIKKMTKSFKDKLGQGGYGSVYKGVLPDGCLVAVKVLIETDSNSNGEEFINEVVSISRTSHVNIVNLLGFCFDRNKRALVYEFMPNKSLDKFIIDNCLNLEKLYKIAVGVAKGLEYLHTGCNARIVHFDIKPQNILLDEDFCPKISDFGLAKLYKKKMSILSVLGTRGTIGYIAPEVFSRNYGGVSHKSDVYSYGMMVLEMAGAKKFGDTDAIESSDNYFPDKIYEHVLDSSKKLDESSMIEEEEEIARKMFFVGFWCIQTNPSDRPSMNKVVEMLEGNLQSIQIPPKPVLFTPSVPVREISWSSSAYVETEDSAET